MEISFYLKKNYDEEGALHSFSLKDVKEEKFIHLKARKEAGTKVLASFLALDCRARRSG